MEGLLPLPAGGPVVVQAFGVQLRPSQGFHDLGMRGQARMIRPRQPQGIVPDQRMEAGADVLKGQKKRVPQVELPGDVGRGHRQEPGRRGMPRQQKTEAGTRIGQCIVAPIARPPGFGLGRVETGGQLLMVTSNGDIASSYRMRGGKASPYHPGESDCNPYRVSFSRCRF